MTQPSGSRAAIAEPPRVDVLGVGVSPIRMEDAVSLVAAWIAGGERRYVSVVPAHTVVECRDDPTLRAIVNASGLVTPDGMSLVWLLRLRGRRAVERVYGPDLLLAVCARSVELGWRHFFLGGHEGVAGALASRLEHRYPGLSIAGTLSPPFGDLAGAESPEMCRVVNAAEPDIIWVGLGSPKQERWMAANRAELAAPVLIGVGAAFDFLSGRKRQAPPWVRRAGLEWLFRLVSEPRRLWRRYARYPRFVVQALRQAAGDRRRRRDV